MYSFSWIFLVLAKSRYSLSWASPKCKWFENCLPGRRCHETSEGRIIRGIRRWLMKVVARGVAESPLTEPRNTNTTGTKSPEMVTRESHQMPLQCWLDYCSKLKLVRLRNSEAAQCPCSPFVDLLGLLPDFHAQTSARCKIRRYVHIC